MFLNRWQKSENRTVRSKGIVLLLVLMLAITQIGLFAMPGLGVQAETDINRTGKITVNEANIRSGPGTTFTILAILKLNHLVTVLSSTTGTYVNGYGDVWYKIRFINTAGTSMDGYVVGGFVTLDPLPAEPDPDFEAQLAAENFPESYKPGLRALHALHPDWQFKALHTGLDWQTAVEEEHTPGYSLIPNSYNDAWKSLDEESYNWLTNTWKPYDGSTWVMCSRALIAYYMDPRNFMSEADLFQFEILDYQPDVHNQAGVEVILRNSFMSNASFTYIDSTTGAEQTLLYSAAFMIAAEFSDISPYHLASRSLVEVGSKGSASVTGLFSAALAAQGLTVTTEYDGYYNFYNIGASSSTEPLGNVRNGLEYAKYGPDRKPELTETDIARLIPWNDRYRAILGGSVIIGKGYIYVGQNTLYLQKFDVDNSDGKLYWHEYMGAIEAPKVEGNKIYRAYSEMSDLQKPITFVLPVFLNMPETACLKPAASGNPNNWLKTLAVGSYGLTPTFDPAVTSEYSLIVENTVSSVQIDATPVSDKSTVAGAGTVQLAVGENTVNLVVTAENGDKRTYVLKIIRKADPTAPTTSPTPAPTGTASPTPGPTASPSPTSIPTATPSPTPAANPTPTTVPALEVQSTVYRLTDNRLTGINPQKKMNTVENVKANLVVTSGYTAEIVNADGTACTGLVGTGCLLNILRQGTIMKTYTVILYGDTNGDGLINSSDVNVLFQRILRTRTLDSATLLAADADHNDKINSSDLNAVFKHVLQQQIITQK